MTLIVGFLRYWKIAAMGALALLLGVMKFRIQRLDVALDKERAARASLDRYKRTRKEIDNATEQHLGDDPELARRWLHERSKADKP